MENLSFLKNVMSLVLGTKLLRSKSSIVLFVPSSLAHATEIGNGNES